MSSPAKTSKVNTVNNVMANKIVKLCKLRGISQAELARRLHITPSTLCDRLTLNNTKESFLRDVAEVLDVKLICGFKIDGKVI